MDWHRDRCRCASPDAVAVDLPRACQTPPSFWYLTGAPELLALAAARLETTLEDLP